MAGAQTGMKRFYLVFGLLAVVGLGALGYLLAKPNTVSIPANVTVQASDTAGFHGYVKGSADAPVEITEYADYQCPFCQTFATLQMPTIEERLIKTGRLRWRYRDFPCSSILFPGWRLTQRPAPTSRASSGNSMKRSMKANRTGRRPAMRRPSFADMPKRWG